MAPSFATFSRVPQARHSVARWQPGEWGVNIRTRVPEGRHTRRNLNHTRLVCVVCILPSLPGLIAIGIAVFPGLPPGATFYRAFGTSGETPGCSPAVAGSHARATVLAEGVFPLWRGFLTTPRVRPKVSNPVSHFQRGEFWWSCTWGCAARGRAAYPRLLCCRAVGAREIGLSRITRHFTVASSVQPRKGRPEHSPGQGTRSRVTPPRDQRFPPFRSAESASHMTSGNT